MSDTSSPPAPPNLPTEELPHHIPPTYERVSATWELEMLISGAVVFALLQLPGTIEYVFARFGSGLQVEWFAALLVGYYYAKATVYALIGCFMLHLVTRAYWVGLIGLDSVYPQGIQWDNTTLSPIWTRVVRRRLPSTPAAINRLDNFASVIFSFGFLVAAFFLLSVPFMVVIGLVALAVSALAFGEEHIGVIFYGTLATLGGVPIVVGLLDRWIGDRAPDSALSRRIEAVVERLYSVQAYPVIGPTMLTLFSNVPHRIILPLFYAVFFGLLFGVLGEFFVRQGAVRLDSSAYVPADAGALGVDAAFYEDRWSEANPPNEIRPSIQSDMIREPYVRLFIRYRPGRHEKAIQRECPEAAPVQKTGLTLLPRDQQISAARAEPILRCLERMHRVALNGQPVPDLRLRFSTNPGTGMPGVVAYLPTAAMPAGENHPTVWPPPRDPESKRPLEPYHILFWR